MLADLPREDEDNAMDALREIIGTEAPADVADDGGLNAATLAFINDLGGVVAS